MSTHPNAPAGHWRRRLAVGACLCAAASASHAEGSDTHRRIGDVLRTAIPVATLATELVRGETEGAWQYTESLAVTLLATDILQRTTHVERPDHSNDRSFPSGHASNAFSAATYVHRRYGIEGAIPLYALATYVGYTRVQADRHRWVDVAGSAAVSAAASWWLVSPRQNVQVGLVPSERRGVMLLVSMPL